MVRINDIEEKKLIIAYSKACSKKQDEILDNRSVYATWRSLWSDDFRYRGVCLRMRKNKFCTTKNSKKKCVCPSYVLKECNTFISSITEWLNDVYNQIGSKKENKEYFEKMIFAYRKSAFAELEQLLKDSGLEAAGYYLTDYTNKRNPIRITNFQLDYRISDDKKKFIKAGSYEPLKNYINQNAENLLQKVNRSDVVCLAE